MFCNNCGKQVPDNYKFCPNCGFKITHTNDNWVPNRHPDPEVPDYDVYDQFKPASAKFQSVCPTCGSSNVQYQTVSESKPLGCFAWTVILFGAFFVNVLVFITLLLLFLVVRKSTKATTYATCQRCGKRWKA